MKRRIAVLLLPCSAAFAHHGQDFLLSHDPSVPGVKRAVAFSGFEWTKQGSTDEISIEPGFLYGIAPGLAIGATVRIADEGSGNWGYSGVNPMLQYLLPVGGERWKFGVQAGYLIADGETHSHGGVHIHNPNPGGIDLGPDAPPPGPIEHIHDEGGHTHNGIHRHGEDHFQFRLLAETRLWEGSRLVANLIAVAPGGGEYAFGYSLGLKHELDHDWSVGLETVGDFNPNGDHEILVGVYWTPVHACTVRLGAGTGIGADAKDFSLHGGITWRF